MERWVVCFHFPDFAVRALTDSGEADVVVGWAGRVWSWSDSLGESGLRAGDTLQRAKALCPEAKILDRDIHKEAVMWDRLLRKLYSASPQVVAIRDRSLHGAWALLENPVAGQLRHLTRELGAKVGVAACRSYAMLAASKARKGKLLVVKPTAIIPFLRETSISVLIPLGYAELAESLGLFGLRSLKQVYELKLRHLKAQFEKLGHSLYALRHPEEDLPVPAFDPGVVQVGFELDAAILETLDLTPRLNELVSQAVSHLNHRCVTYMEVGLYTERGFVEACRLLKSPLHNFPMLSRVAQHLLSELMKEPHRIHGIRLTLGGMVDAPVVQERLFKEKSLVRKAIEAVERRFPSKLLRGVIVDADPVFHEDQVSFQPIPSPRD